MAVITELDTGLARITEVARTDAVMPLTLAMVQGPLRSRLAIGHITLVALVIGWVVPTMSGARDTGHGVMVCDSGFVATTL